ncbi:hypothetical protein LWI29_001081 [Acer saccharum]|uniref:TF-B3 domain-containing protein n=1 Tax=Acer saccharum TaxID=4024 RepID=A0AA39S044_ACESA|nr:hypothetical protein LWI29_001081 [Acer saccharum]
MEEAPQHFFKVIRASTLQDKKLMISEKFVRIFGNELSTVTLTVPNGRVWKVGLIRDGRTIWFRDGWHDFVKYNSISAGYFLLFKYGGNSNFNVLIFDLTACEIEYPYYGKEPENDRHNLSRQDESENEDSIEIIDVTAPNPTFESPKNKAFDKCPRSSSVMPSQLNRAKPSFVPDLGVDKNQERGYESQNKRRKKEELVGSNQSNAVGSDINLKKTAYEVGTHSSDDAAKFDGDGLVDLLNNMGICVPKGFGNIAFKIRERAIAAARLFKPKNPSFMVIRRSTENHRLYVPVKFARKYFSTSTKSIKVLDSDGRKWSAQLTLVPKCFMTKLGRFGKNLDGGDICVFELVSRNILKVSVLKIRDVVKEGGSKQTSNVKVEEVAANNRTNKDQKKSSENEGGSKKRVVVKEGVSKDTRNVMAEEAAAINEGGSKKMSTAKSGGFERTTVQPERVGVSKLVQPRNPFFIAKLRTKAKKHLLLVPSRFLKDHMLDLSGLVFFRNEQGMKSPGNAFIWNDGRTWITGWKDFCTQNSLGLDDHCICEFLPDHNGQMGDTIQVHIIRNAGSGS